MEILPESSLKLLEKDERGFHHVIHRYKDCGKPCFSFDCVGGYSQCEFFHKQLTGVKGCRRERQCGR